MIEPPLALTTAAGRPARVAIVHEWLEGFYGSERVVEQMLRCFPGADLFVLVDVMPEAARGWLGAIKVTTSFIQHLPFARRHFRHYLPLMPLAVEQFDLGGYDLILSSSHAFAKGVLTGPRQLHVSYVHAPMRYAWEYQHQYLRESGRDRGLMAWPTRYLLHRLRLWDARTAHGIDHLIANSTFIGRRIAKIYGRTSTVIHPPVETGSVVAATAGKADHYIAISRFVPYKRTELICEAFAAMPGRKLIVIGDGPGAARVKPSPNVTLMGFQPAETLHRLLASARALVFAAEEDFGITVVEAQAAGTPVIAYGAGGALETVRVDDGAATTGVFFREQTVASIIDAVTRFEAMESSITAAALVANAARFTPERFRREFTAFIQDAWSRHPEGGQSAVSTTSSR